MGPDNHKSDNNNGYDNTGGTSNDKNTLWLELSNKLSQENIVEDFILNESSYFVLKLNHEYDQKIIPFQFDFARYQKSMEYFERFMVSKKDVKPEHAKLVTETIDLNHEHIIEFRKSCESGEEEDENNQPLQKIFIRKYTANGMLALHESLVISDGQPPTFLHLGDDRRPQYASKIEIANKIFYPKDTMETQNPLPYIFKSARELEEYLELAKKETFQTLYFKVELIFRKYINAEEHYIIILAADTIYSYFQDKFGTTHYNIFIGDNGSGKNSALLVYRYLGYRVFYITAASAANYYTFLGEKEEGQGTIAEDEAEDIGYNRDKQKVFKTGYCSGGSVPKVDLLNGKGRSQDSWLTYCHKWIAMEALPDDKKIKGILDRALVYNFVAGDVPYNIKDVIKYAGDPKYKTLNDELKHIRKLLFAFRMVRYNDTIPDIDLNIIHRSAELTKPLLRLFNYRNDSPVVLDKIRLALSKFIKKRNEQKKNSLESKLRDAVNILVEQREKNPESEEYEGLQALAFYNEQIWTEVRSVTNGTDIPFNSGSFYSVEYGKLSYKFITGLYRSKFNAEPFRIGSGNQTKRGLTFSKDVLDRLGTYYYDVPDEIEIIKPPEIRTGHNSGHKSEPHNDGDDSTSQDNSPNSTPNSDLDSLQTATDAPHATHYTVGKGVNEDVLKDIIVEVHENNSINSSDSTKCYNKTGIHGVLDGKKTASMRPLHCPRSVASVASVAYIKNYSKSATTENDRGAVATRLRGKVKEVGLPAIPCMFCSYSDPIEFDLVSHYLELHKRDLLKLPIGKGSMEYRADYSVKLAKRKHIMEAHTEEEPGDE